jgi:8-amino-7-oxononanoate synthase
VLGPIFSDKLNHASMSEALRSMPGGFHRYRHADLAHLESLLAGHLGKGPGLVCSETLFSMDGDLADVVGLLALQERYGFWLYLDEAHSTGCRPDLIAPALTAHRERGKVILMGTFGKAYGGFGAYLAGPPDVIEWLANTARSFIFSTALPPAAAGAALEALKVAEEETWRRERLEETAAYARDLFRKRGFRTGSSRSHILPVIAGGDRAALRLSEALYHAGYHAPAVRPPTVPDGTARLRINLTSEIGKAEIDALADELSGALDESANEAGDG